MWPKYVVAQMDKVNINLKLNMAASAILLNCFEAYVGAVCQGTSIFVLLIAKLKDDFLAEKLRLD